MIRSVPWGVGVADALKRCVCVFLPSNPGTWRGRFSAPRITEISSHLNNKLNAPDCETEMIRAFVHQIEIAPTTPGAIPRFDGHWYSDRGSKLW